MHQSTLALAGFATLLASCGSNSNHDTIELLKAGDAKTCIAPDVEQELRKLVFPTNCVAKGYTVTFSDATLETFDKIVSKASCHANIKIDAPSTTIVEKTGFDFTVVPAAQDPEKFVVSASLDAFANRVAGALASDAAEHDKEQTVAAERAKLIATVKDGWLLGRWVAAESGSNACVEGPYSEYGRNHRYVNERGVTGTWRLTDMQVINIIGPQDTANIPIIEADQDSFVSGSGDAASAGFRRCSQIDATPRPEADADADEPDDTSGIDAENTPSGPQ